MLTTKLNELYGKSISIEEGLSSHPEIIRLYEKVGVPSDYLNKATQYSEAGWTLKEFLLAYLYYYDQNGNLDSQGLLDVIKEHLEDKEIPSGVDIYIRDGMIYQNMITLLFAALYDEGLARSSIGNNMAINDYTDEEKYWLFDTALFGDGKVCHWNQQNIYKNWIKKIQDDGTVGYCAFDDERMLGYDSSQYSQWKVIHPDNKYLPINREATNAFNADSSGSYFTGVNKKEETDSGYNTTAKKYFLAAKAEADRRRRISWQNACLDKYKNQKNEWRTIKYPEFANEIEEMERDFTMGGQSLAELLTAENGDCKNDMINYMVGRLEELAKNKNETDFNRQCKAAYTTQRQAAIQELVRLGLYPSNSASFVSEEQKKNERLFAEKFPNYNEYNYIQRTNFSPTPSISFSTFKVAKESVDDGMVIEISTPASSQPLAHETIKVQNRDGIISEKECHWKSLAKYYTGIADSAIQPGALSAIDPDIDPVLLLDEDVDVSFDTDPHVIFDGGGDNTNSNSYKPDVCYSGAGPLGWVLCPAISAASTVGEHLYEQIEENHLKLPSQAIFGVSEDMRSKGIDKPGIRLAWEAIRDIANIGFVLIALVVIVSQVSGFGISNYGIKKILPKLIVSIILVNLSYVICQLAIDMSNIIGVSINSLFEGISGNIQEGALGFAEGAGAAYQASGWISVIVIAGGATTLFALFSSIGDFNIVSGIVLLILGIVIVIVVSMLTLYITLIVREAAIIMGIALAPVAILCNILPRTEPLFKKWLSLMKALLVLYPVCSFVIGSGKLAGIVLASTGLNSMRLAAGVVQVIPFFFVPSLLRKSLAGLGNIGNRLSSIGKNAGRRASHGAKNAIKNTKLYQERSAFSRDHAVERRAKRKAARLQKRSDAGLPMSEYQNRQLQAYNDLVEKRKEELENAKLENQADQAAVRERERKAKREAAFKERNLVSGGATTNKYGDLKRDKNGHIIYNDKRAEKALLGYDTNQLIQAQKRADDLVNIGRHAQDLTKAARIKQGLDRRIETAQQLAYVRDLDKNGNVVAEGEEGVYKSKQYRENQRTLLQNRLNNTLASGHVAPLKTNFGDAISSYQIKTDNEFYQNQLSQYAGMSSADFNQAKSDLENGGFNSGDNYSRQKAAALITRLLTNNREEEGQKLLQQFTANCGDLKEVQDLVRNIDAGKVEGVSLFKSAINAAAGKVTYDQFLTDTIPTDAKGEMKTFIEISKKKAGGVTAMDSDTIKRIQAIVNPAEDSTPEVKAYAAGILSATGGMQKVISAEQALWNIVNVNKEGAQSAMKSIIAVSDGSEYNNLSLTASQLLNITKKEQVDNLKDMMSKSEDFKNNVIKTLEQLTDRTKENLNTVASDFVKEMLPQPAPQPASQPASQPKPHPNTDGSRYYYPNGEQRK